ncbi:type II toxin-antitoxin system RelE/ParE family toxin [Paraglaciecola sp.]|uniref:type II toxin-antitoxin system RelE/ParE family toxin n=1 Tax=Paraglaciecola sp. TaxID=1920173 RepID=UPI003EF54A46
MKSTQYKLSSLAQEHLRKVKANRIENFSEPQWQAYKATLLSGFQLLADNPSVGRLCFEIYANGFYFPVGKHMAYFTKEKGVILIVAVLNQSQLPQNYLG